MRLLPILAGVMLLATGSGALAQSDETSRDEIKKVFDRGCGDDEGTDRCDSDVQRRMRGLYNIDGPVELLEQGVTMRRAMFVDGYGNDVAAITFSHRPGESPVVEVKAPQADDGSDHRPLVASVSKEAWATVLKRSRFFDLQLARELPSADGLPSLCLHAWFVVAEAVDAPRVMSNVIAGSGSDDMARDPALPVEAPMEPGKVRADAESACAEGLAIEYAFELAELALDALPECGGLDLEHFRNEVELLGRCYRLRGDRLVAGEANVIIRKLDMAFYSKREEDIEQLFVGLGDARAKLFQAALDGGSAYLSAPRGIDADHAVIEGQVIFFDKDTDEPNEVADISLQLLRQVGDFVIDTFSVRNRRPYTPK